MQRVRGVDGIFFKSRGDRTVLLEWYRDHLGIDFDAEWGGKVFGASDADLTWSIFKADTTYFSPGSAPFMVNYIVDDLVAMLTQLRDAGVEVADQTEDNEYGKFGWAIDPEGSRLERWQRPAG